MSFSSCCQVMILASVIDDKVLQDIVQLRRPKTSIREFESVY